MMEGIYLPFRQNLKPHTHKHTRTHTEDRIDLDTLSIEKNNHEFIDNGHVLH